MSDTPKELLLQDYRYRAEALAKNEQGGETRVNLFIGLLTLVGGLMASLITSGNKIFQGELLRLVILAGLFSALVLGVITMLRMISRNKSTDQAKRDLDVIRQTIKDRFDEDGLLLHYTPFGNLKISQSDKRNEHIKPRKFGGLAHTMAALNSLLVSGLVAVIMSPFAPVGVPQPELLPIIVAVLVGFVISLAFQVWYIELEEHRARQGSKEGLPTHAGGVVFRRRGKQVEYLLVRLKSGKKEWVLSKGHIESGEGHSEAAVREVREESGVFARPLFLVDRVQFVTQKERVDAKFYLMQTIFETSSPERREIRWATADRAVEELSHVESRYLVRAAEQMRFARTDREQKARSI